MLNLFQEVQFPGGGYHNMPVRLSNTPFLSSLSVFCFTKVCLVLDLGRPRASISVWPDFGSQKTDTHTHIWWDKELGSSQCSRQTVLLCVYVQDQNQHSRDYAH